MTRELHATSRTLDDGSQELTIKIPVGSREQTAEDLMQRIRRSSDWVLEAIIASHQTYDTLVVVSRKGPGTGHGGPGHVIEAQTFAGQFLEAALQLAVDELGL